MKFKSLKAYNTYSFPILEFTFNYRGTTLIIGRSEDESTANGAGKTTIIKALYLGLWGKELYDATLDSVTYRNATDGWLIEIIFELNGHEYKICRYRDRKDQDPKTGVKLYSDGVMFPGEPAETQKEIEKKLGMTPRLFKSSVLTAQGESEHFLTVSDTKKKEIFSELLDLIIYSSAHSIVKDMIDELEEKVQGLETKIEMINERIKEKSEELVNHEKKKLDFEVTKKESIVLLEKKRKTLENDIQSLRDSNKESNNLLEEEKGLLEVIQSKTSQKESLSKELECEASISEENQRLNNELTKIKTEGENIAKNKTAKELEVKKLEERQKNPSTLDKSVIQLKVDALAVKEILPELGANQSVVLTLADSALSVSQLVDADSESRIDDLKKDLTKINEEIEEKRKCYKSKNDEITQHKIKVDDFKKKRVSFSVLDGELTKLNKSLSAVREKKQKSSNIEPEVNAKLLLIQENEIQIDLANKETNPYFDFIELTKTKIKEQNDLLSHNKKLIGQQEEELQYYNFWKAGFSPLGIRSFIFDEVIDLLNQKVQDNLNELFDGALSVVFESESKNGKGTVSNKIDTKYYMRGKETYFELLSGGEKRRAILAVNLALTELAESYSGTVMNIKFLDEPFDGIDGQGQTQCFKLFARLAQNKDGFFVISHDQTFQQLCPNVIYVLKENEASRIVTREEFDPLGDISNSTLMTD
jgi:DNA repair exonuclease SbcCD ATPase subunit